MADFNPTPNPKNDPSYMGFSQGTDRASLQPLADQPQLNTKYVQPEYYKNTSLGKLFEGVSDLQGSAVKLTDNIIKENINKDLTKGIDQIRDSFGVAKAVDQRTGLAQAAGQAGAETTLTGGPTKDQPLALARLGNKIDGLYEAYVQGTLSNSNYYAKMEAYVRETKARYPGYSDEVDQMTREKLGVNPANAVRAALLDDTAKLAAKVAGQNDKWTTWERQNASTISQVYGGYEQYQQAKAEGRAPREQVEAKVANHDAAIASDDATIKRLSLASAEDKNKTRNIEQQVTGSATRIVDNVLLGIGNGVIKGDAQKLQQYVLDVQSGKVKPPTPDEKAQLEMTFAKVEQQVSIQLDDHFNASVFNASGQQVTRAGLLGNESVKNIKALALSKITGLKEGIFGQNAGLMGMDLRGAAATDAAAENSVLKAFPALANAGVAKKRLGDSGVMDVFLNAKKFRDPLLTGFQQYNWGEIAGGQSSMRKVLEDAKKEGADDGVNNRKMIQDTVEIINNPEKMADPTVSQDAVKHLYGPDNRTLIEGVRQSNSRAVSIFFNESYNAKITKSVSKMPETYKTMYTNSAEDAFTSVFNTEIDNVNQTVKGYEQSGLKLTYSPETNQFKYEAGRTTAAAIVQSANSKLIGFNSAISGMSDIWKGMGAPDTTAQLARLLPIAGIEPGSPVHKLLTKAVLDAENEKNKQ